MTQRRQTGDVGLEIYGQKVELCHFSLIGQLLAGVVEEEGTTGLEDTLLFQL